jgi:hypothetical protein
MTLPASTQVGRLAIESRHLPATQGGGGDIHDVMATSFGIRLLIGDVMGTGLAANRTGLSVLNAWRELACTEPSLAGVAVRLHALITRSEHPERFVTALLVNFPSAADLDEEGDGDGSRAGGPWAELVCCGHSPPLLLRGGSAAFIEPAAAPPLGLLDLAGGWCQPSMVPIAVGDQLLLYTDGVSEARDAAGRFFPLAERTAQALHPGGPGDGPGDGTAHPAGHPAAHPAGHPAGHRSGYGTGGSHLLDALVASLGAHVGDRVTDDILLLLVTMRSGSQGVGTLLSPGRGRAPSRA